MCCRKSSGLIRDVENCLVKVKALTTNPVVIYKDHLETRDLVIQPVQLENAPLEKEQILQDYILRQKFWKSRKRL